MAEPLLQIGATGTSARVAGLPAIEPTRRATLVRRVRLLVAFTIAWNVVEAVVALAAGAAASSSALLGFGLDSVIEVSSAVAVAWQFSGRDPERRERIALWVIAGSFAALAVFVTVDSVRTLAGGHEPEHSPVGIGIAALSLLVMPFASWIQRRTGRELGSNSAVADSKQTLLCTYMSAALLAGLLLNSTLGWWWADPIAGLAIAALALREARESAHGDLCCTPAAALFDRSGEAAGADHADCAGHAGCGPACACC